MFSHHHALVYPFFFFNDTATTEIYTLSLHDALPISRHSPRRRIQPQRFRDEVSRITKLRQIIESRSAIAEHGIERSEEHTSELQSPCNLVCRLLLEKKKQHY